MKVFIAQKIEGLSEPQIKENTEAIKKSIIDRYQEHINFETVFTESNNMLMRYSPKDLWNLGEIVKTINGSDMVFFAPGWKDSKNCRVILSICTEYDIPMEIC